MAKIDLLRPRILEFEGGFQNNPDDKANYTKDGTLIGTNKGVSANTFEGIFRFKPTVEDIQNLTDDQFDKVLETFGVQINYDNIHNQSIADIFFDWIWASGVYYPSMHVQELVGVTSDGSIGEMSTEAINNYPDQEELFNNIKTARLKYVDDIISENPDDAQFKDGWVSRINKYVYLVS